MSSGQPTSWDEIRANVNAPCPGCPRSHDKKPVMFTRKGSPDQIDFVILSQEPGQWLAGLPIDEIERKLLTLCVGKGSPEDLRKANPLVKVVQAFGAFDPTAGRIYWTHALKCVPPESDRAVNKEWRKAATKCEEHLLDELRAVGKGELNLLVFGKFALEMALHLLEGQDIDPDISISEFMQSRKLPITYRYKFKDGMTKVINLFVFTNPSSEVVKIMKSGGKLTVEEIQELEMKRIKEILASKKR